MPPLTRVLAAWSALRKAPFQSTSLRWAPVKTPPAQVPSAHFALFRDSAVSPVPLSKLQGRALAAPPLSQSAGRR